ncbi:MAG: beta-galactosidase [Thermoanaerobaculia bacterium]
MRSTLAVLVLAMFATTLAAADRQQSEKFFPMAVWYGGGTARAPMLEPDPVAKKEAWRKDVRQIRALGFNTIRAWVDWASAEPEEGVFDFRTIETLADLAHEEGLRLEVQVYMDSAPAWVGQKYPDSHFVSISGEVMPSESAPGYCFDHPGVRAAMLNFYSKAAEAMKSKPAFLAWDLWSEPHIINWAYEPWAENTEYCFCPYSVARFRDWVRTKYGTLDALNKAWYRRFKSWDEVRPNRLGTILSYTDFIDWRMFIRQKLAGDLAARYEAVKSVLPDKLATSHAAIPNLFTSPRAGDGSPDDLKMTEVVDYFGTSFYPKHSMPVGHDPAWCAALLDFAKSSGYARRDGFWIGELQAGFGTIALHVSAPVTPQDESIWIWSALARGAKAVNVYAYYPMSSGYESGGFGLINLDGTVTPRAKAAGAVAAAVDRNQELFLKARPIPAEVAIVFNPLSYMVGGRRPLWGGGSEADLAGIETRSMLGPYRALFPTNVPLDFIHVDQIAKGEASKYKLIILPYPLMLSQPVSAALIEFVRAGGTLVTEARPAWNDERGYATAVIPGSGLAEVCACREESVQNTPSGKTEMTVDATGFPGLEKGNVLTGSVYQEVLVPESGRAQILARWANGKPAMIASSFGKGKMLTIGTFFGAGYERNPTAMMDSFYRGLLDWAKIANPVTASDGVEVRILESGRDRIAVIVNHGTEEVTPTVRLEGFTGTAARDLMSGEPVALKSDGGAIVIQPRMAPESVLAIHIGGAGSAR